MEENENASNEQSKEELQKPKTSLDELFNNNDFENQITKTEKTPQNQPEEDDLEIPLLEGLLGKNFTRHSTDVLKSLSKFIESQAQRQIDKTQIEKQQLENDLKISEINLDIQKEVNNSIQKEQKWIAGFDIRNKVYSSVMIVCISAFIYFLATKSLINEQALGLLLGIMVTIVGVANMDILGKVLNRKKENPPQEKN